MEWWLHLTRSWAMPSAIGESDASFPLTLTLSLGERPPRTSARLAPLNLRMRNSLVIKDGITRFMGRERSRPPSDPPRTSSLRTIAGIAAREGRPNAEGEPIGDTRSNGLPLPEGEGRGEGEGRARGPSVHACHEIRVRCSVCRSALLIVECVRSGGSDRTIDTALGCRYPITPSLQYPRSFVLRCRGSAH